MPNPTDSAEPINLLPENAHLQASPSQILFRFMITRGKSIIVLTEALVLLVFLSRFKLDRQVSDLQEALENKSAIVEASLSIEQEFQDVQKRTARAKQLINTQPDLTDGFTQLSAVEASGITLTNATVQPSSLELTATTQSAVTFGLLIGKLVTDPMVSRVILKSSSFNPSTLQYSFTMQIMFAPKG